MLRGLRSPLPPPPTPLCRADLNMLCQTNGRERSAGEYAALLEACGWTRVQAKSLPGSYLDAVIAFA